ncbi:hypothetical protein CIB95_06525 [Lottiidibacillus patelloidae]|uniref:Uncharacterized protein n=1 Tax=Lottiidibacillus patelloidae TaxID=2670334 RepID=A0A263BTS7_9BACI|nr:hypothetical protein [Lottiidibacillus patelloidae]OZM57120.1 hypothetical protein CIB95_06525 [Lottiidibacillus patelloidae]
MAKYKYKNYNIKKKKRSKEEHSCLYCYFKKNLCKRALIMTPSFPYLYVGVIEDVLKECVVIDVETTHLEQLENRIWHINFEDIEVFYIEDDGKTIPNLSS